MTERYSSIFSDFEQVFGRHIDSATVKLNWSDFKYGCHAWIVEKNKHFEGKNTDGDGCEVKEEA